MYNDKATGKPVRQEWLQSSDWTVLALLARLVLSAISQASAESSDGTRYKKKERRDLRSFRTDL